MDVSVIIVNWNTGDLLRRALDRLPAALGDYSYEVIVVDNASVDQSIAKAEGSPQPFRLLAMKTNLGFARANNIAIRQAKGETIVLLNPDTEALPGSIAMLVTALQEHPQAATVGPRLLHTDGSLQRSCRRFPTVATFALLFLKAHHLFPNASALRSYFMMDFPHDREQKVDQIMGACMVIPRAALERIGLLDERYWIWFEEVDFCKRAAAAGREIWFIPAAEIIHHGGVSFRQVLPVHKEWRFIRSSLRYTFTHIGILQTAALLLLIPLALALDAGAIFQWLRQRRMAASA